MKRLGPSFFFAACALTAAVAADSSSLLKFPAAADLKNFHPLYRNADSALYAGPGSHHDTLWLRLQWKNAQPWAAIFSQNQEFDETWVLEKLTDFAPETSPNPLPDPLAGSPEAAQYPGLKQQWLLRGMRTSAWMGSGVNGFRYFVIFRAQSPAAIDSGTRFPALQPNLAARLDTAAGWFAAACSDRSPGKHQCYRPHDDAHFLVEVTSAHDPGLVLTFEEGDPLTDVRSAAETLSDQAWPEYSQDLSALLHGEAVRMLSAAALKIPQAFTWPAWKFLDWKEGAVPPATYLSTWRATRRLADPLAALQYHAHGLAVTTDLYLDGRCRITAEADASDSGAPQRM